MPGEAQLATQAAGTILGIGQTIGSLISAGKANKQLTRLFKQRRAFQTPEEIFDILQMRQNDAASGYSPQTLSYLTSNADAALGATLGSATKLGADPNQLGAILDPYFRDIFKVGNENELVKMKKFDALINATSTLAQSKEAEQVSRDNLIKDQMQAQAQKIVASQQNMQSGMNLTLNSLSGLATTGMYNSSSTSGDNSNGTTTLSRSTELSGIQGLTPSQQLRLKQLADSGLLD